MVKGALSAEGTLTAHFDTTWRGDAEMLIRAVFATASPAQWNEVMQNISYSMGFAGKVTNRS